MITQEHIDNFSPALKQIMEGELKLGNIIAETAKGWPAYNTIIVFLQKPFIAHYETDNVVYRDVNDRHYWKAEYTDKQTQHILACFFE
ncbi:hypothetical protein [Deminuibacter soli]|uniref:Uncharacterized protein n=1 Tax=Deminuibacter soli TaxID=2291815 RepID=A0A3E1NEP6_9BACT|nr:hypothetical protein [Deminuibacter soli]RFM26446.1 hypothetical protein DXN05_19650 [Deminuibacter soli]